MKGLTIVILLVVLALLGAGMVYAAPNEASVAQGKALFNDPKLGTSGKTCGSCHPNGSGLEKAAAIKDLPQRVNNCISKPLKGNPLDVKSTQMQSLVLYIKSIGAK
jgi:cytochrome c peroxidase